MRYLLAWFRRRILGRVAITTLHPHGVRVGDGGIISGATDAHFNGQHVVTRIVDSLTYEVRPFGRKNHWPTMRYLLKMFAAFAASLFLVVKSAHLAADGKPVTACILGLFVFALFFYMAAASVKAEREAGKK